jgi:hypothetical protein
MRPTLLETGGDLSMRFPQISFCAGPLRYIRARGSAQSFVQALDKEQYLQIFRQTAKKVSSFDLDSLMNCS